MINKDYDFKKNQDKWNKYWEENETFKTDVWDFSKPKYYCLDMFPYPSGSALHVGHPLGYIATDIMARYKRMKGFNVLHPMGWDSFGLPSEQYAIETGNNPAEFNKKNIEIFKNQLKNIGLSFDWSKEISTSDPKYYKWTQWIFKKLFEKKLAKKTDMLVNWSEDLGTVLSNDEIIDGKTERGGYPVTRKNMPQWVIEIPKYAEKLLEGLDRVDYPESTKEIQRNWIGKSIGAEVEFKVDKTDMSFTVFTTRCDTLFGVTYCVLSPDHNLVDKITTKEQEKLVKAYKEETAKKSDLERTDLNHNKTGVFTGSYAINPVNNKKIPIYIADYVLSTYATGAIMAVPAHDKRDFEFAKKFNLEIIKVLDVDEQDMEKDGIHISSGFLDGLNKKDAIEKMLEYLEKNNLGKKKINYKMRDWIFSRQRYWGEPIPIVELEDGTQVALDDKDLPLELPVLEDYKPFRDGRSALARAKDFINVEINGKKGKRELSTMPGSAGSSWYFLRYIDPHNDQKLAEKELLDHWMPVDLYVGGTEHAVGHLLYSRMWTKFLHEEGILNVDEPYKKLFHQGMMLGANGIKMGKRYKDFVVNPNDIVNEYGADALRLYQMFMGPLEASKPWSNSGIVGAKKFLDKVVRLLTSEKIRDKDNKNLDKVYNYTIKKCEEDYENLSFNTAIAQMMIFINDASKEDVVPLKYIKGFLKLLNPICPYLTEEFYQRFFNTSTITYEEFPKYDEEKLQDDFKIIGVQINGKLRSTVEISINETEEEIFNKVFEDSKIKSYIYGKDIIKKIYIKNKIVNIVVK
ncbi:MAG: leucine--tRNA ligase [Clostridiales bacterium]|nr:leucine--tRNA ligase [Clostridiales bacterium]